MSETPEFTKGQTLELVSFGREGRQIHREVVVAAIIEPGRTPDRREFPDLYITKDSDDPLKADPLPERPALSYVVRHEEELKKGGKRIRHFWPNIKFLRLPGVNGDYKPIKKRPIKAISPEDQIFRKEDRVEWDSDDKVNMGTVAAVVPSGQLPDLRMFPDLAAHNVGLGKTRPYISYVIRKDHKPGNIARHLWPRTKVMRLIAAAEPTETPMVDEVMGKLLSHKTEEEVVADQEAAFSQANGLEDLVPLVQDQTQEARETSALQALLTEPSVLETPPRTIFYHVDTLEDKDGFWHAWTVDNKIWTSALTRLEAINELTTKVRQEKGANVRVALHSEDSEREDKLRKLTPEVVPKATPEVFPVNELPPSLVEILPDPAPVETAEPIKDLVSGKPIGKYWNEEYDDPTSMETGFAQLAAEQAKETTSLSVEPDEARSLHDLIIVVCQATDPSKITGPAFVDSNQELMKFLVEDNRRRFLKLAEKFNRNA